MLRKFTQSLFLLFALVLVSAYTEPETLVFSADKSQFLSELRVFINQTNNKDYIALFDKFEKQVSNNAFTNEEFGEIVRICNKMGEVRMKVAPFYTEYLKGLNVVKYQQVGQENFMDWHETLDHFLKDIQQTKFKEYARYLAYSQKLFSGAELNKAKGGIQWSASGATPAVLWEVDQPVVKYLKTDLTAVRKQAKIYLKATSGVFYPLQNKWVGQGGLVSWKHKHPYSKAVAELSQYEIDMTSGMYTAPDALLSHPDYLGTKKVKGLLRDRVGNASNASFPVFESQEEIVSIKVGKDLVYTGGFKLQGAKIEGYAGKADVCSLLHTDQTGQQTYRLSGQRFALNNKEFIYGKNVEAVLYFGQDSIYHPGINSKADLQAGVLTLSSGEKAISKAPFYDSYHGVYVQSDKMNWYPQERKLMINESRIKAGTGSTSVRIESKDFYNEKYLRRLQNVANYNPVVRLMLLARQEGNELSADAVAQQMNPNFSVANIQSLLFDLEANGFIRFLPKENIVKVFDKVYRYAEVHAGKKDFDFLSIKSDINGGNAEMDLEKKEMLLRGVKSVEFSKRQRVAAAPSGKQLVFGENRSIDYDGTTYAGFAVLEGSGYAFDYEKFRIHADSVRYLNFFLPEANGDAFAIASSIEHATGTVLIDAPNNKSGREDLQIFPSFKSTGKSYVYYDKNNKLGEIYPRDEFYFELEPFFLQGLRQLSPEHFDLKGKMYTADILPVFEETLRLQEDLSLGFETELPVAGYDIYKQKGNFQGKVRISNQGLSGTGKLNYEKTDIDAQDIIFRPKDMTCSAEHFNLEEDVSGGLPKVIGKEVSINWKPYADSMYVQSKEQSFDVFTTSRHTIDGNLIYSPGGLKGSGIFKWDEGAMDSKLFDFGHFSVASDTVNLQIKALQTDALAFDSKNVSGVMDFDNKIGNFKANEKDAVTEMPYNKYKTTLNEFKWDLNDKNITFVAPPNTLGQFTSTDKAQKGLSFAGDAAKYDFNTGRLEVSGIEVIESADAFIYPDKGEASILPGGQADVLRNARITASRENKYHEITGAEIQIHSKEKYTGSGYYDYSFADTKQQIKLSSIIGQRVGKKSLNKIETVAEAQVGTEQAFAVAEGFEFEGRIELKSSKADLGYTGFARFKSDILTNPRWFYINCRADRNDFKPALDAPKDKEAQQIQSGFFLNKETKEIYSRLLMPLQNRKDHAFIRAEGMLRYDAAKQEYLIGDSLKIMNPTAKGSLLTFNEKTAVLKAKGGLNLFPVPQGPTVNISGIIEGGLPAGELTQEEKAKEGLQAKVAAAVTMGLPKDLREMMYTDFHSAAFDANTLSYHDVETYEVVLPELVSDAKKLPQSLQQLQKGNSFSIPAEDCTFDFLLTELNLVWDADYQSFISAEDKLGVAILGTKAYHKSVKGSAEFKTLVTGEAQFTILLTSPSGNKYFFDFKNGILSTRSDYEPYNQKVNNLKTKERMLKTETGTYELTLASGSMVSNCLMRAQAARD